MKVFLDTNIFLDMIVLRDKRIDNENAALILKIANLDDFDFCISPITVSTSFYISRKDSNAFEKIGNRLKYMQVLPMDERDVSFAMSSDIPDKEDAMQISCAERGECEIILTRDSKHFSKSPIQVLSPTEFLTRIRK